MSNIINLNTMNTSLENKKVDELKQLLKKYDLVSGITQLKRDDLIKTIRAVKKYKDNKQTDYTQFTFGDKLVKLNDEQYRIVTSDIKKNIRIIAAAGTGKTSTIICRLKYLIDNGVDPERIMITSFNCDAAESIKNKLIELFGFLPKYVSVQSIPFHANITIDILNRISMLEFLNMLLIFQNIYNQKEMQYLQFINTYFLMNFKMLMKFNFKS